MIPADQSSALYRSMRHCEHCQNCYRSLNDYSKRVVHVLYRRESLTSLVELVRSHHLRVSSALVGRFERIALNAETLLAKCDPDSAEKCNRIIEHALSHH